MGLLRPTDQSLELVLKAWVVLANDTNEARDGQEAHCGVVEQAQGCHVGSDVPDQAEHETRDEAKSAGVGGSEPAEVDESRHDGFLGGLAQLDQLRSAEDFRPDRCPN